MMKTLRLLLAMALVLIMTFSSALAEPRYPTRQGSVTDAAAVLSASTVSDLNEVAERLKDETDAALHIAAVDFLDGVSISVYGEGLRNRWDLSDDDVLLLLAVGEDQFGLFGGDDFNDRLPVSTQQKLLSAHLQTPFMAQDYDAALRAFIPALVNECAKAWNEQIHIGGLLGAPAATVSPFDAEEWLLRRVERQTSETQTVRRVTDEDEDTGISLGKVILTIFLLTVIFGKKNRRHYHGRPGCGCGCMPFSSILAALGLWKLWDKD